VPGAFASRWLAFLGTLSSVGGGGAGSIFLLSLAFIFYKKSARSTNRTDAVCGCWGERTIAFAEIACLLLACPEATGTCIRSEAVEDSTAALHLADSRLGTAIRAVRFPVRLSQRLNEQRLDTPAYAADLLTGELAILKGYSVEILRLR
jgi:hypothetical protein